MRAPAWFLGALALWCALARVETPAKLAKTYADAIHEINEHHLHAPGKVKEDELARELPAAARKAFDALIAIKSGDQLVDALVVAAEAAADLDLETDFAAAQTRLEALDLKAGQRVGRLVSRERFVVRGTGGLGPDYVAHFADVFEAILGAYDEVFGFAEWSKVPGKKLRVLVHLEAKVESKPHFAPEFAYHSQIDFPVDDAKALKSPTDDGKFLLYGLCHELGHVIAMWGDAKHEADFHAWAHYCGVVIVEHLASDAKAKKLLEDLRDAHWRTLAIERNENKTAKPSLADKPGVMALLIALHDAVGPKAIGAALNALDAQDRHLRINSVRYYEFADLKGALLKLAANDKQKKAILELLP
jgi:hypothetical protein